MSSPCRAVQFTLPAAFAALGVSIYRAWSRPRGAGSSGCGGTLNSPALTAHSFLRVHSSMDAVDAEGYTVKQ